MRASTHGGVVRLLFDRIVVDQAFPLELKVPNAETRSEVVEAEKIIHSDETHTSGPNL